MGKRKRAVEGNGLPSQTLLDQNFNQTATFENAEHQDHRSGVVVLQIIAGTYDKILHGITATMLHEQSDAVGKNPSVEFADTFLFNAHSSAIRCLALSPPSDHDKITLASGSSDQTINLYHISARSISKRRAEMPSLAGRSIVEPPKNRELGSLQHHAASINALKFPTRSKLLSSADDSTIGVARTRDWTVLSSIKVPIPKAHRRPSGDTAPLGGAPAGVNDFAIHPSLKLMVSVSKGEKCMRLWNLVTGKKAGVLNFDKALLQEAGEGRRARGEGLRVEWNIHGEEFVVSFEKGAVVFGLDSKPKGVIKTSPLSKIHQIHYIDGEAEKNSHANMLAVSTEDGRVVFFSTTPDDIPNQPSQIRSCPAIGQIGGAVDGSGSRVKDFEYLKVAGRRRALAASLIVTCSSDGTIGLWKLDSLKRPETIQLPDHVVNAPTGVNGEQNTQIKAKPIPQVGQLLGKYETGNRITCLKAFVMADSVEKDFDRQSLNGNVETNGHSGSWSDDNSDSA